MHKNTPKNTEDNDERELVTISQEEFTDESLEILKKNAKVWNAQYVNDPHEGQAEFDQSWKKYYYMIGTKSIVVFLVQDKNPSRYNVMDFDRVILIDPSVYGKRRILVTA